MGSRTRLGTLEKIISFHSCWDSNHNSSSLVTVPSALLWKFSVLNKFNRVPRIPVVILNYTLFILVKFATVFLMACNWSPSRAI